MRLFLALFALVVAASAAEPNTLTPEEKEGGWKLLFDGKTTEGWRALGKKEFPAKGWVVEEGALKRASSGGNLVTAESYENFEFSWEWKISSGGNSGVKYNLIDPNKDLGCEYQLTDDLKNSDAAKNGPLHQAAALYDLIPAPADKKLLPAGEWNQSRLIVKGNKVEQWLNGAKTVEFEFGSEALKALVAKSKYKGAAGFGIKTKSPILLQDHGDVIEFRSLKIHVL